MATEARRAARSLHVTAWVAAAMTVAACGSDGATGAPPATDSQVAGEGPVAVDVVAELDYLGDLAMFVADPIAVEVDSTATQVSLPDSATVIVPAGAFEAPTVLTAGVAELDFASFEDGATSGRMYLLATVDDVDLGVPVVLEIPVAPETVRVAQQVEGEWQLVDVPPGPTSRVPIIGFSTVPTAVVGLGAPPPATRPLPGGDTPAEYLSTCVISMAFIFDEDDDDGVIDGFAVDRALSMCTAALVDRLSPDGVYVSVACVGDRIDDTGEIESAVATCADEARRESAEPAGEETTGGQTADDETAGADGPEVADDTVVIVEGRLTGGPVVEGAGLPTVVLDDRLEFVLSFGDAAITGEGVADREIDGSNDDCIDRYISPLSFDFDGAFTGEDSTAATGSFDWRVDEGRFVQLELEQLGDAECEGRTSFASGAGEWSATWDPAARTFVGSMTLPGGLGTNTFELTATTVISSD